MTAHAEAGRVDLDISCDVLVVGGGGAGLAAAITAAERGVRVVLVERRAKLGGSTAISVGSITAAGTSWQRAKGISDSVDAFIEDMASFPGVSPDRDSPALRAVLAAEATPALEWLSGLGVPFVGPFPEPPHRVPRMHNVVPDARMYIACLERAARKAGVRIELSAEVHDLISDPEGGVLGVVATIGSTSCRILAERAVILSTGDFSGNAEMRKTYLSAAAADSIPANPESTGKGHLLGLKLGAGLKGMDVSTGPKIRFRSQPARGLLAMLPLRPWLLKPLAGIVQIMPGAVLRPFVKSLLVVHMQPSPKLFEEGAILVNLKGERFCEETQSTLPLAHQPDAAGYLVFDETIAARFRRAPYFISTAPGIGYAYLQDYERARPELVHRAANAAELAQLLGADAQSLERSVASTNGGLKGPFVALGPAVSTVTVTEGGLSVDSQCAVIRDDGSRIERLFAAGGVAQSGMRLYGHGLHIGWAIVSGRLSGQAAAQLLPRSLEQGRWRISPPATSEPLLSTGRS